MKYSVFYKDHRAGSQFFFIKEHCFIKNHKFNWGSRTIEIKIADTFTLKQARFIFISKK